MERTDCLAVFFNPKIYNNVDFNRLKKYRVIQNFFKPLEEKSEEVPESIVIVPTLVNKTSEIDHLIDFYQQLRISHENDDLTSNLPSDLQHSKLKPILRPYQARAIKWMLKRELHTDHVPQEFVKMTVECLPDQIFYYNPRTLELSSENPCDKLIIPSGGILADEMGKKIV